MTTDQEKKYREEFEVEFPKYDPRLDCAEGVDIYLTARKKAQEDIEKRDKLLDKAKNLVKDIGWNTLIGDDSEYPEYSKRIDHLIKEVEELR